jgi:hypothetical protein
MSNLNQVQHSLEFAWEKHSQKAYIGLHAKHILPVDQIKKHLPAGSFETYIKKICEELNIKSINALKSNISGDLFCDKTRNNIKFKRLNHYDLCLSWIELINDIIVYFTEMKLSVQEIIGLDIPKNIILYTSDDETL